MRTDFEIQQDVVSELKWHPTTMGNEIAVAVKGGVVTLAGVVHSYMQKFEAERAVERISGVKALADDLEVRLPQAFVRSDTEVAHSALNALKWNIQVPDDQIKVKVDKGIVTLEGMVEWQYQAAAAEDSVRPLIGVKRVVNLVGIRQPKTSATEVSQKIADAFKRSATIDSKCISVDTLDGKVTLRGTVRSWAERQDAKAAAWSAAGVHEVEDRLAIQI